MRTPPTDPAHEIGRTQELERLVQASRQAMKGVPQFYFLTGEAGLGKSTLARRFIDRLQPELCVGVGQCVEQYGRTEPYLPMLEALAQLCRGTRAADWRQALWRFAPSWLAQMPGLVEDEDWETLERRIRATTPGRMLRELAEALEHVTPQCPTLLVIEDLHWSDEASLECLNYLAQRSSRAHLLLLGTVRLADADAAGSPVGNRLREGFARGWFSELALAPLSSEETAVFIERRAHPTQLDPGLVEAIHQRAKGNPLFVTHLLDDLLQSATLPSDSIAESLPTGLLAIIQAQLTRLTPDQQELLELAAVAGVEFLAYPLAIATKRDVSTTELELQRLSQAQHLVSQLGSETLSSGVDSGRYAFRHALYRDALYHAMPEAVRRQRHARLALGLLESYGDKSSEIAGQLAAHWEGAGDREQAVSYMLQAGMQANRRAAFADSVKLLRRALDYLDQMPRSPSVDAQQLRVRSAMVPALLATTGYGSRDLEEHCLSVVRGGALADPQLFPIVNALRNHYFVRADYDKASELGQRVLDSVRASGESSLLTAALKMAGDTLIFCGDPAKGCKRLDEAVKAYDSSQAADQAYSLGLDAQVSSLAYSALGQWLIGSPSEALARSERAVTLAERTGHPHTLGFAYLIGGVVQTWLGDFVAVREYGEALAALSQEYGLSSLARWAEMSLSLASVHNGDTQGLERIVVALEQRARTGEHLAQSLLLAGLADAALLVGDTGCAVQAISQGMAFVRSNGELSFEPELQRLQGELALKRGDGADTDSQEFAKTQFRSAFDMAKRAGSWGLALRAAMSLARIDQETGGQALEYCYDRVRGPIVGTDARQALRLLRSLGYREPTFDGDRISTVPLSTRTSRRRRSFRREGDYWTLVYEGSVARVKDSRGMSYLAQLLQRPNREIHALDLVSPSAQVKDGETPVVDARAKDNYRKRFNELKAELEQAEQNNDQASTARLSEELEWLRQQLSEAFGLGGRPRATGSAAERARVSTTRAIRKALQRIQEAHPSLGEHLHRNLKTGQFCCYDPDRQLQMTWRV